MLACYINAIPVDNNVEGEPEVECGPTSITVNFNIRNPFEGHVYAKGLYDQQGCRNDEGGRQVASIELPFDFCNAARTRSLNPKRIFVSNTVVISFHPQFVTKVDRAYRIQCLYMEADKTVLTQIEVSDLATAFQTQCARPTCAEPQGFGATKLAGPTSTGTAAAGGTPAQTGTATGGRRNATARGVQNLEIEQLRLLRKRSVHSPDEQVMDVRTELSTLDVMQARNFVFYKIVLVVKYYKLYKENKMLDELPSLSPATAERLVSTGDFSSERISSPGPCLSSIYFAGFLLLAILIATVLSVYIYHSTATMRHRKY
ncbi:hypothetical protein WR25_20920 [Diploscapter pachys]|uniref:ZP domain-containing protein n=1 Tax=Diploscapter pachys TaxID=2018661 RepID=A0A2A2KAG7_9BILA|nr:hypothetical protein WR25_20920 [Diploscapter pachys]